jgi:uncharacterized integral membrane protein
MGYVKTGAVVLMLALVIVFAIQNMASVEVNFLFWSMSVSKFVLVLLVYVLGMASGWGLLELLKKAF